MVSNDEIKKMLDDKRKKNDFNKNNNKCHICKAINRSSAKFCYKCGNPIEIKNENPYQSKDLSEEKEELKSDIKESKDLSEEKEELKSGFSKSKYLICDSCHGYYELQPGENAEDFAHCQCGGDLKIEIKAVQDNKKEYNNEQKNSEKNHKQTDEDIGTKNSSSSFFSKKNEVKIIFGSIGILFLGMLIILSASGNLYNSPDSSSEVPSSSREVNTERTSSYTGSGRVRISALSYNELKPDNPMYYEGVWASIATENGRYWVIDDVWQPLKNYGVNKPFLAKVVTKDIGAFKNAKVIVEAYDLNGNRLSL